MTIQLATKYEPYVDEVFKAISKRDLISQAEFDFTGAKTIKLYKIGTADMTDYGRNSIAEGNWSHYGEVQTLDAITESLELAKDRSFTFEIDKLDEDETNNNLAPATALNRQIREVVIPEVDTYAYKKIVNNAGMRKAQKLTSTNIYDEILFASAELDDEEIPEENRFLLVTPNTYKLMKQCDDIVLDTDIGQEIKSKGVIGMLDGAYVIKVPANRLPNNFGFLMGHPQAIAIPVKLQDYKIHTDPAGLSGSLVEGRINYDAFVLENKITALYYDTLPLEVAEDEVSLTIAGGASDPIAIYNAIGTVTGTCSDSKIKITIANGKVTFEAESGATAGTTVVTLTDTVSTETISTCTVTLTVASA